MKLVLARIKKEGPLQSKDFKNENRGKNTGWWDWKPAKKALERLFLNGELEVAYRDSFRKVYDLPENVVPSQINTTTPSEDEYFEYLIRRTIRSHGFASVEEMGYLCSGSDKKSLLKKANELVEGKKLIKVSVEGVETKYYSTQTILNKKVERSSQVHIFSPFDNLVIQRNKLKSIFGFDYQIECYIPEAKRQYGYFSLPLFKGIKPLGRMDCKVDRKTKELLVKSIHSESEEDIRTKVNSKLKSFAKFNGCEKIVWGS